MLDEAGDRRVVVITGASGGIGAALAEELAGRGAVLVLAARRPEALAEVAGRCGTAVVQAITGDMTIRADVDRVLEEALARHGRVDAWINNVGRGITRAPSQLTDADLDLMVRVNITSALYGMQAVVPHFQSRGRGHVVNISSMLGRVPHAVHRSAYSAAKHFLNALTINYRMEVQATHPGIQFSLVSPGVVRTEFGAHAVHGGPSSWELPDSQGAEEVAVVIADLLESRRPDLYTRPGSRDRVAAWYAAHGEDP
jgi:short-subunit dehydrogenase